MTVETVTAILVPIFLALLSVIGTLVLMQTRDVKTQICELKGSASESSKVLVKLETDMASVGTTLTHHSEMQDEFCERLASVEKSVLNTERIAVLEKAVNTLENEIEKLRPVVHQIPTLQQTVNNLNAVMAERHAHPSVRQD